MLAALLVVFLGFMTIGGSEGIIFGTSMVEQIEKQIKITIEDKERRNMALDKISAVEETLEIINEQTNNDLKHLEILIKNYNSTPHDFDQLFVNISDNRQKQLNQLWDDRQDVLQHIEPVEWQAIVTNANLELQKDMD